MGEVVDYYTSTSDTRGLHTAFGIGRDLLKTGVVRVKGGFAGQVTNGRTGEVLWQSAPKNTGTNARDDAKAEADRRLDEALAALFDDTTGDLEPTGRHLRGVA